MRLFSLSLLAGLLLFFETDLKAQPLTEIYQKQQNLRSKVEAICRDQFQKAQYLPVRGQQQDLRFMISEKGVQAIKPGVVPTQSGRSYECDRAASYVDWLPRYDQLMLLGRTYTTSVRFLRSGPRSVRRERLELEPCEIALEDSYKEELARLRGESYRTPIIATSCLVSYTQLDDGLVNRSILAFREQSQSK